MAITYIVDVSAVMPNFIAEVYTPNAQSMFREFTDQRSIQLGMPEFGKVECVNVLWKQVRFSEVNQDDAEQLVKDVSIMPFKVFSVEKLYVEAFQIGIRHKLAIYDSIYIALAKHLNYPLITVDQKQASAAQQERVTLKPITDFV